MNLRKTWNNTIELLRDANMNMYVLIFLFSFLAATVSFVFIRYWNKIKEYLQHLSTDKNIHEVTFKKAYMVHDTVLYSIELGSTGQSSQECLNNIQILLELDKIHSKENITNNKPREYG